MENLLRPVLISAMMVCLATPPVLGLQWALEGSDLTYFLVFCFFAGLEGILSERLMARQRITGWSYLVSRSAEFLVLALLLKAISYLPRDLGRLWVDLNQALADPGLLVSMQDGITTLLLLILWMGALVIARQVRDLDVLGEDVRLRPDVGTSAHYLWLTEPSPVKDREAAFRWLGEAIIWGGILLLVASASVELVLPEAGAPVAAVLLFFALGVALLSQARFSVSHASWTRSGVQVQSTIPRRWLLWSLSFLIGVALVAMVLPTEYMMGPIMAIYNALFLIFQLLTIIASFLAYGFAWLLALLLPSMEPPEAPEAILEPVLPEPEQLAPGAAAPSWFTLLVTTLFWLVIISIVVFALLRVFRERLQIFKDGEGGNGLWRRLLSGLRAMWRRWRKWGQEVQERVVRRLAGRRVVLVRSPGPVRFFSLHRLSPRGLVRYFYLSTARRAAQAGHPRRPSQTPSEYRADLEERFPELEPDLSGLTDAFIRARYSPQTVRKDDADAIKPLWQRIKTALRRQRVSGQTRITEGRKN